MNRPTKQALLTGLVLTIAVVVLLYAAHRNRHTNTVECKPIKRTIIWTCEDGRRFVR